MCNDGLKKRVKGQKQNMGHGIGEAMLGLNTIGNKRMTGKGRSLDWN